MNLKIHMLNILMLKGICLVGALMLSVEVYAESVIQSDGNICIELKDINNGWSVAIRD
ncbi:hypothetical protein AAKU61_004671, partial [Undibacterium sp. GrIS 1.2]